MKEIQTKFRECLKIFTDHKRVCQQLSKNFVKGHIATTCPSLQSHWAFFKWHVTNRSGECICLPLVLGKQTMCMCNAVIWHDICTIAGVDVDASTVSTYSKEEEVIWRYTTMDQQNPSKQPFPRVSAPPSNIKFLGPTCPLSSDRQHLSYDVCLEVRGEIIRTALFCIVY